MAWLRRSSQRAKNKAEADRVENKYTSWRNAVLAATSFIAPLLLALYSRPIQEEFMLILLIADLLIGLIAFIVFNNIKAKIHRYIQIMEHSYFMVLNEINSVAVSIGINASEIDEVEIDRLQFFRTYIIFVEFAVEATLMTGLVFMSRSWFLGIPLCLDNSILKGKPLRWE